jgi:hypothetical protein
VSAARTSGARPLSAGRLRYLTQDERFTWGECPVCHAPDRVDCYAEIGVVPLDADGSRMITTGEGVHLGWLERAPFRVREVPV